MHHGEITIDADLVGRLVAEQFPWLSDLPICRVQSTGTVNAIYRIGDLLSARLPRMQKWAQDLDTEWLWLPKLAPGLSLRVPEPVERGQPSSSYPCPWAIYGWIEGQPFADELIDDEDQAAKDLAQFVVELRRTDHVVGAPLAGRKPLRELDAVTRAAIESARGVIDSDAATDAWALALEAPAWAGTPVWIHTDLLRPNLLALHGRLCAVLDFGGVGVGDPAADVIAAWSVFSDAGRRMFRDVLDVDDGTWNRARGFALHQAAMIIPYYELTNPGFVALAKRTVEEVLTDLNT
jgi:aminoglycoside phosphotransferase (APT) family kinase protein